MANNKINTNNKAAVQGDIGAALQNVWKFLFPEPIQTPGHGSVIGNPQDMKLTYGNASPLGAVNAQMAIPTPTASPVAMAQQMSQQPQGNDNNAALAAQILAGYRKYSGGKEVPMEKYIPQMVEAAKKYPVFQKNPYLIPATSIVETSAGQNWKLNNNPLSWAARIQSAGGYSPSSPEQSINDMITAVGGDPNRGQGYDPETAKSRMQSASYYDKFRNSNNLQDYTSTYDSGNEKYYPALVEALKNFQNQ